MTDTSNPSAQLKALCPDDLEAVIAIDRTNSGASRRGYFTKRLQAAIDRPRDYVYVGLHMKGTLAGFAFAKLITGEFGKPGASAALDAIGVDLAFQGKGAGRALLGGVENILRNKSVTELTSQIDWANQPIINFLGRAGFALDTGMVLVRSTDKLETDQPDMHNMDEPLEIDHSAPVSDDPAALSHDKVLVRSMTKDDLQAIIAIDRKISGAARPAYFERKQYEALHASGIRMSLIAELDGYPVGFIMARVDYGEFGHTGQEAVMDTLGVNPGYQGHGVGQALMAQLIANLSILKVETVRTEVAWDDTEIIAYLSTAGFTPAQKITLRHKL